MEDPASVELIPLAAAQAQGQHPGASGLVEHRKVAVPMKQVTGALATTLTGSKPLRQLSLQAHSKHESPSGPGPSAPDGGASRFEVQPHPAHQVRGPHRSHLLPQEGAPLLIHTKALCG